MKKRYQVFLCLLISCILACTDFKIGNDDLKGDLEKGLQWRPLRESLLASQVLTVHWCKATEGHSTKEDEYILSFEAKLKASQTFYCSAYFRGFFKNIPDWGNDKKQFWEKITKGKILDSEGSVYYKKLESGWKLKKFDAPIMYKKKELTRFRVYKFKLRDKIDLNM